MQVIHYEIRYRATVSVIKLNRELRHNRCRYSKRSVQKQPRGYTRDLAATAKTAQEHKLFSNGWSGSCYTSALSGANRLQYEEGKRT